jgi:transposase
MSTQRFTPEFKEKAVRQVRERDYSVAEVGARLGVFTWFVQMGWRPYAPQRREARCRAG